MISLHHSSARHAGRLPDFLVIGATKAGTSSLHAYLCAHADVMMHPQKELRFFTTEHNFRLGLEWYARQFADADAVSVAGESSNAYTRDPVYSGVPARIASCMPDVKLVYLVRDPMERLQSHYRHRLITATEWRTADHAIAHEPSYVAASLYGHQLEIYLKEFRREQILVIRSERLFADPPATLDEICTFLGVTRDPTQPFVSQNVTASRPVAPRLLRAMGRLPAARPRLRRMAAMIGDSAMGAKAARGNAPDFTLSPATYGRLEDIFAADQRLLAELAGHETVSGRRPTAPEPPLKEEPFQ